MLVKLESDNLFITERLKEIDENYFIVYNTKTNKYEIHYEGQANGTFCVGLPFISLDSQTLKYVYKTQTKNIEKIIKNIKLNNQKIEENKIKKFKNIAKEVLK